MTSTTNEQKQNPELECKLWLPSSHWFCACAAPGKEYTIPLQPDR